MNALVTGSASGIGRATTSRLLQAGWQVWATDANEAQLRDTAAAEGWQATLLRLDVRDPAAWQAAVDAVPGRLDVLLHCAGVLRPGWVADSDGASVDFHVDVNVKGTMLGFQAAARRMVAQKSGHIVVIASMAALAPIPGLAHYSASKYAVRAFALAAGEELRPHGVAVSVVCPDAVATPMLDVQRGRPEAAMTFSGPRVLTTTEVARVLVDEVLVQRPLLRAVPWSRGVLARLGDLLPGLGRFVAPMLQRKGMEAQRLGK